MFTELFRNVFQAFFCQYFGGVVYNGDGGLGLTNQFFEAFLTKFLLAGAGDAERVRGAGVSLRGGSLREEGAAQVSSCPGRLVSDIIDYTALNTVVPIYRVCLGN